MKPANEAINGRIVGYDERRGELLIRAPYNDYKTMTKRNYSNCNVILSDSRIISDKQRRACYALIRAICDYTGYSTDEGKRILKIEYLSDNIEYVGDKIFSLANAPMALVCEFQKFLIDFILDNDIPTDFPLLDMVDDYESYIYSAVCAKKCVICGKHADLHHRDRVGTGRDRSEIIHEGLEVISLCRTHHTEEHTIGTSAFDEKYHLKGGVIADKAICRIYKLKGSKNNG